MTTSDYAFIISLVSLVITIGNFIWNIWSKFIFPKPKVKMSISKVVMIDNTGKKTGEPVICLSATNLGPSEIVIYAAISKSKPKWYKKSLNGMLQPMNNFPIDTTSRGPFSGGLPKKLAVGEEFSSYFPIKNDWFSKANVIKIGYSDTFSRAHWCSSKQIKKLKKDILKN